jgi:hypothetical protein
MAGTIPLSMTQQFDVYGNPLAGGQLYIIQAGTVSTPQDAFADLNLTVKMPYPMALDAAGRIPQFFLADGTVKIRLQDKSGVVQLSADQILVIGPSAGGGGGGAAVDPTQLIQTGNLITRYGVGPLSGYVRLNNLTIGSSTSGATERANQDTQNLYLYLWGADPSLPVYAAGSVVTRLASALLDWNANHALGLPDGRSRLLGMLGDMGNSDAGFWTGATFTRGNSTTLGSLASRSATPNCNVTLGVANLPPYTPVGSVSTTTSLTTNGSMWSAAGANNVNTVALGSGSINLAANSLTATSISSFSGSGQGGTSTPFNVCPPIMLITVYIKL